MLFFCLFSRAAGLACPLALWIGLAAAPLLAGPTLEKPDLPLEVRPEGEVEQLRALAQQLFEAAEAAVKVYHKKRTENELLKVGPREIGKTYATIKQFRRAAERLKIWGEGAAIDYLRRADRLDAELQNVIDSFKLTPGGPDRLKGALQAADAALAQRQGELLPNGKISKMAAKQSWEDAETAIHDALDEIDAIAVWLDRDKNFERVKPFLKALDVVRPKVLEVRQQRAQASLSAAFRQIVPNYDQFFLDLGKAEGELKARPEATFEGKPLSGPDLAKAAIARFRALHLATIRVRGLAWARGLDERAQTDNDLDRLLIAQSTAASRFAASLVALVEADAQRAAPEQAPEIYQKYLPPLAEYVSQLPDDAVAKSLTASLDKLASKSSALTLEVAAYRRATGEVLRWRALAAASGAKRRKMGLPLASQLVLDTARSGGGYGGLVTADATTMSDGVLLGPASEFLRKAQTKLAQQKVLLQNGIGGTSLNSATTNLLGRFDSRVVSQSPAPPPREELDALRADLFVTPTSPALSLEAAAAIAGAERGDAIEWGVVVTGCELRPLVTGWATLPEQGALWWPPAPFVRERGAASDGPVLIVLTGGLKWVRGKHLLWEVERN